LCRRVAASLIFAADVDDGNDRNDRLEFGFHALPQPSIRAASGA
jgi:hypothetical protein